MTDPLNFFAPADRPVVPLRLVVASVAGLWLCYFLLVSLRGTLLDFTSGWEMLWRRGAVCGSGMAFTLVLWRLLRLFDARQLRAKILAALMLSLPVALVLAQVNHTVFRELDRQMEQQEAGFVIKIQRGRDGDILTEDVVRTSRRIPEQRPGQGGLGGDGSDPVAVSLPLIGAIEIAPWPYLTEMGFSRYFMLLAWSALYLAMLAGEKARLSERREGEFRRAAKAAQLRSLRYQVNPHFLFNTLNSLSALILTRRNDQAEAMVQTIASFYRRSLAADPTADVPLAEEFALQRLYLDIEMTRFPQRLRTSFDLPAALADALVPGMILQPLVENAVKHGVAPLQRPVTIALVVQEERGQLVISVSDDGGAADRTGDGRSVTDGLGIGLENVRQRLEARFGDAASLAHGPQPQGYRVEIRLPLVIHG